MTEVQTQLTRRRVVTAGAWSVPVIAAAAAVPAHAASPGCDPFQGRLSGTTIHYAGVWWVELTIAVDLSPCGTGTSYGQLLSLSFTLDSTAFSGYWASSGVNGWSPRYGFVGTYDYTLTHFYDEPVGTELRLVLLPNFIESGNPEAPWTEPKAIPFTLSGPDGVSVSTTIAP